MRSSLLFCIFTLCQLGLTRSITGQPVEVIDFKPAAKNQTPPPFAEQKKEILRMIDSRIAASNQERSCVKAATNKAELRKCQQEHMRAMKAFHAPKPGKRMQLAPGPGPHLRQPCGAPGEPPCGNRGVRR